MNVSDSSSLSFQEEILGSLFYRSRFEGKPLFIDFTADWCLTCKVNENHLETQIIRDAMDKNGLYLLKPIGHVVMKTLRNGLKSLERPVFLFIL